MHHTVSTNTRLESQWVNGTNGHIIKIDTLQICRNGNFYSIYTHIIILSWRLWYHYSRGRYNARKTWDSLAVTAYFTLRFSLLPVTTSNNPVQQYQWVAGNTHSNNGMLVVAGLLEVTLKTINPLNGCSDSVSLNLAGPINFEQWHILPFENLDCIRRSTLLSVDTTKYHSHEIFQWRKNSDGNNWQVNNQLKVTKGRFIWFTIGDADGSYYGTQPLKCWSGRKNRQQLSQVQ